MERLAVQTIKNGPREYDRIFQARLEKGIDEFDLKRWNLLLKKYFRGKLIDLGCLDSMVPILAKGLHPRSEVWGLDRAELAIEEMQIKYPKVFYHVGDLYNTKFRDGYFDYVVLGEVLEHLDDPPKAVKEALRILKKHGTLAISVPLNESIEPGAKDLDRHIWSFTVQDIRDLVKPYQAEIEIMGSQTKPYKYNFPNIIAWIRKK